MKVLKKIGKKAAIGVYILLYKALRWFERTILCELAFRCDKADYLADPVIIKRFNYKEIEANAHVQSYWDYARMRIYEKYPLEKIEEYLKGNEDPDSKIIYYEIGANIGYSVLIMGKILNGRGEVFAFEIEPTNFKTLTDNILINQLLNVTAMQLGVAECFGIQKFYYNRYHDKSPLWPSSGMGMHSVVFDSNVHNSRSYFKVPLMPLDSIIRVFSLPCPTHVFIDAYGAEDTIVSSMGATMRNDKLKMIMVDIESMVVEESSAHRHISGEGFKLVDCVTEESVDVVPTSYKCTYFRG